MAGSIHVRGAREHNLKNVDVVIPRDSLTVITGLSGSGKSSLAFDTIYAEGQRRYVEVAVRLRPPVPGTDGQAGRRQHRGPVAGDLHRAEDHLAATRAPPSARSPKSTTTCACSGRASACPIRPPPACRSRRRPCQPDGRPRRWRCRRARACCCSPRWCATARANTARNSPNCSASGFTRVKVDGKLYEIGEVPALNRKTKHEIEAVVDRIVVRDGIAPRLADSFETALALSDGVVYAENADTGERTVFSSRFACPVSGFTIEEIEPRLFSFNSPHGACPACDGLGMETFFDPAAGGAGRAPVARRWRDRAVDRRRKARTTTRRCKASPGISRSPRRRPGRICRTRVRDAILNGTGDEPVAFTYKDGVRAYTVTKPFEGVLHNLQRRLQETDSVWVREELSRYQAEKPCAVCNGARLKPEALAVRVAGNNIAEASELSIRRALDWFGGVLPTLTPQRAEIAAAHPARDRRSAAVPGRCRAGLPDPGARLRHAVRRRVAAHPPGQPDRLRPDRRAVRAGRALDRPAPARQRTPARPRCGGCATSATPCWWSNMTRTRSAPPTT